MWTVEQRQAHDRAGLRYPSDLTDEEWALVEPFIPPAKRGGRRRTVDIRAVLDGIYSCWRRAANGGRCPRTCRRGARCTAISPFGPGTAR
jgi:transposase